MRTKERKINLKKKNNEKVNDENLNKEVHEVDNKDAANEAFEEAGGCSPDGCASCGGCGGGIDPETMQGYPVMEFEVTGEHPRAIQMLPGYAHSITNLSKTENLVTVMWANEPFDPGHPDTFYEPVAPEVKKPQNPEKGNV